MSYFATCLDELLKRKRMKAVDLAKSSGVGESMVSRYRSGEITPSREDLEALSGAISDVPSERAELIRAHLLDECHGPGAELISIKIFSEGDQTRETAPAYMVKLPDEAEANFTAMREAYMKDSNVKQIVDGVGGVLRFGDARTSEERSNSGQKVNYPTQKTPPVRPQRFGSAKKKTPPQK